jgi:hypothetical protein
MLGFIYIMSNPAHPGLLKIGQTSKDPLVRRKELSTTGVPEEFVIEYQALVSDYRRQEKYIHQKLSKVRHSDRKEFFSISVPEAINTIREQCGDKIKYEEVIHTTSEELEKVTSRKIIKGFLKAATLIILIIVLGSFIYTGGSLPPELFLIGMVLLYFLLIRPRLKKWLCPNSPVKTSSLDTSGVKHSTPPPL